MILQHYYPRRAAVTGQYLSNEIWDEADAVSPPIDQRDAEIVERLILQLPRNICNAVRYTYIGRPRMMGTPDACIRQWVEHAAREIMASKQGLTNSKY